MGVDDHTNMDAERVPKHDIGGFAPDAVEGDQFLHRSRNFAAMLGDQPSTTRLDILCLVPKQPDPPDVILEFGWTGVGIVGSATVLLKQFGRDEIHLLVGALRRENGGDKQFKRAGKVELAMSVRIGQAQLRENLLRALVEMGKGFAGQVATPVLGVEREQARRQEMAFPQICPARFPPD